MVLEDVERIGVGDAGFHEIDRHRPTPVQRLLDVAMELAVGEHVEPGDPEAGLQRTGHPVEERAQIGQVALHQAVDLAPH